MAIYTAHLPPDAGTPQDVAEKAVFVKEGFAVFGFAFTGLWLLSHRLWWQALTYVALFALTLAAFQWFDLPRIAFGGVTALLALLIGLEGNEWIRRRHAAKGWTHAGTVSGPSLEECERRFFKDWLAARGQDSVPSAVRMSPGVANTSVFGTSGPSSSVLGVFPAPRGQA
jgi:Protein of unknown function (DUF2628)